jgi:spermidine synthase
MDSSWDIVDSAATDDGTVLVLVQAGDVWEVRVDHHLLMASDDHHSEDALSDLALLRVPDARRILIGGLGMGYTLRAALDRLPRDAVVVVAEMSPALVGWNRTMLGDLADNPLNDERVLLRMGDVGDRIREGCGSYDVILLDVDNGPEAVVHETNASLYNDAGVADCFAALSPGGVVAIWSAGGDAGFVARLAKGGFKAEAISIDETNADGVTDNDRHVIFVATKPA